MKEKLLLQEKKNVNSGHANKQTNKQIPYIKTGNKEEKRRDNTKCYKNKCERKTEQT